MNLVRKILSLLIFIVLASSLKAANIKGLHRIDIGTRIDSPAVDSTSVRKTRIRLQHS